MLNIVARFWVVKDDIPVILIQEEQSFFQNIADFLYFFPWQDVDPFFQWLPFSKFFEKLKFLQFVELFSFFDPVLEALKFERPCKFILSDAMATQGKVVF